MKRTIIAIAITLAATLSAKADAGGPQGPAAA